MNISQEPAYFYTNINPTTTNYQVPSNLTGGVISNVDLSDAASTSIFTAGQGSPVGIGINAAGKMRTVVIVSVHHTTAGAAGDTGPQSQCLSIYELVGETAVAHIAIGAVAPAKPLYMRLPTNGGVGFSVPGTPVGTNPRLMVTWYFAD